MLIALAASAQAALAADGTVNFVGKLIDTPCSVSPNSANLTVPLGSVSTTSMNGVGKRSTPAKFTIDLLNCSPAAGATAVFTGDARVGVGEASASPPASPSKSPAGGNLASSVAYPVPASYYPPANCRHG